MIRAFTRRLGFRLGIPWLRHDDRPPTTGPDAALIASCRELADVVHALHVLLVDDRRDTDDVPGFEELADREHDLIRRISSFPAYSLAGVIAKARAARLRREVEGYGGAVTIALSLCDDLIRLGSGLPLFVDPALRCLFPLNHDTDPTEPTSD